eukprot:CAMPEP_0194207618 /NCGR_PEP_ID=MMETSP0156-20130528/6305_1 /TAXON_ID=33649 /ORGANISM="Thalassionema nitzschioides, Strain L26-B" /LENGTH=34 /DNA_ID= /DNA_START= /DNA_END= /DNA_ORIENTATION=
MLKMASSKNIKFSIRSNEHGIMRYMNTELMIDLK